jgi:hypothetical protein
MAHQRETATPWDTCTFVAAYSTRAGYTSTHPRSFVWMDGWMDALRVRIIGIRVRIIGCADGGRDGRICRGV